MLKSSGSLECGPSLSSLWTTALYGENLNTLSHAQLSVVSTELVSVIQHKLVLTKLYMWIVV